MILGTQCRHLAGTALVLLALGGCAGSSGGSTNPSHGTPSAIRSTPAADTGATSLPARWWAWVEASAPAHNPVDDATGADCAASQPSDVWFLAGTHGGSASRACTVPVSRPIYVPVINQICTMKQGETATQALTSCIGAVDSATASLDGHAIRPAEATSQTAFTFTARPNSSTGFTLGPHQAVAWGLWIGPLPLTEGHHTLTFAATSGAFATSVVYQLNVTDSGVAA